MSFESLHLIPSEGYDPAATRAWLSARPWAFADPHGSGAFHLSGRARDALAARERRVADPSRFPPGVVVNVRDDGLGLEALADAATMARAKEFVTWQLSTGSWRMKRDWLTDEEPADIGVLFPEPLPDTDLLVDDPLGRPVLAGRIVVWARGEEDDPAGVWEIEVHSSGALAYSHTGGGHAHRVRGELDAAARLAWLEAAAHLDEDDDELFEPRPKDQIVRVGVETPDDDWSLFMDGEAPSRSAEPLARIVAAWQPLLEAWDGPGLPPDLARAVDAE